MNDASPIRRFLDSLHGRRGRRVLLVLLLAGVGAVLWWYLGRMPSDGTVEVRWTEDPPSWISITYVDAAGATVRWRREDVAPGVDRFRDSYRLSPGNYWLRIEYRRGDHVRSIRKRVELPSGEPYLLMLDELDAPR